MTAAMMQTITATDLTITATVKAAVDHTAHTVSSSCRSPLSACCSSSGPGASGSAGQRSRLQRWLNFSSTKLLGSCGRHLS